MCGKQVQEINKNKHSCMDRTKVFTLIRLHQVGTYPPLFRNSIVFHRAIKRPYNDLPSLSILRHINVRIALFF